MKLDTLAVLATGRSGFGSDTDKAGGPPGFCGSNRDLLRVEMALAGMEGGAEAAVFSSGLAATWAVLQTLRPGDHVVASEQIHTNSLSTPPSRGPSKRAISLPERS